MTYALIIPWIVLVLGSSSPIVAKLNNAQIEIAYFIYHHAEENNISPEKLLKLAVCESGINNKAVGDKGKAQGIFQFHKPTFNSYSKQYNAPLMYNNATDQIYLAARVISDGGINNWRNCKNKIAVKSSLWSDSLKE